MDSVNRAWTEVEQRLSRFRNYCTGSRSWVLQLAWARSSKWAVRRGGTPSEGLLLFRRVSTSSSQTIQAA